MSAPLVEVEGLHVDFPAPGGAVPAVAGAGFTLERGRALALVGESGSGKSTTALALPRLLAPGARLRARRMALAGRDLTTLDEHALTSLRGREIGCVFQDPGASLDPVMRVGSQVAEGPRVARSLDRRAARERALELFARVGLPDPREVYRRFPHQLSGGQRQRVALAMALASEPALLIADEPTTALDPPLQAVVLELVAALSAGRGMALLLVAHDLALVARAADEVAVMYAGRVVERGPAAVLLARPRHPYTAALLRSHPARVPRGASLRPIPGAVGDPRALPSGCPFRTRCELARERCAQAEPPLEAVAPAHASACWYPDEVEVP